MPVQTLVCKSCNVCISFTRDVISHAHRCYPCTLMECSRIFSNQFCNHAPSHHCLKTKTPSKSLTRFQWNIWLKLIHLIKATIHRKLDSIDLLNDINVSHWGETRVMIIDKSLDNAWRGRTQMLARTRSENNLKCSFFVWHSYTRITTWL